MLKQLRRLFKNQSRRTVVIVTAAVIMIAAVFVFIEMELVDNDKLSVSNYVAKQQEITDLAADEMSIYLNSKTLDTDEAINKLIREVKTEGSSYWFIAQKHKLIFVKNKMNSELFEYITLTTFLKQCKNDGIKVTTSSFTQDGTKFTVGNCTKLSYIEEKEQLFRHHIYIIMPFILISAFFFVQFIYGLIRINQQENKIIHLNSEAMERNIFIEQLSDQLRKIRLNRLGDQDSQAEEEPAIYNKEVLVSLLDKLGKKKIVPLTIIILKMSSNHNILALQDVLKIVKSVSAVLENEHVLAQISPDLYSILVFHTSIEQCDRMKDNIIKKWAVPLKSQGIKVKIGISCIEDYDADVKSIFDVIYKEVSNRKLSDS